MAQRVVLIVLLFLAALLAACERALGPGLGNTPVPTPTSVAQLPETPLPTALPPTPGPATATLPAPTATPRVEVTAIVEGNLAESVVVEALELAILESMPVQVEATLSGHFTLSCTLLDNVAAAREGNTFTILYDAVKDVERACSEAVVPFSTTLPLDVAGLPAGKYAVHAGEASQSFTLAVDNVPATPPPTPTKASPPPPTPAPTATTPPPAPTPIPADAGVNVPTNGLFTRTTIHLIALEDAGASGPAIGCGDSVIPVIVDIEPTAGVMTAAFNRLLSLRDEFYGESGLYNALYRSSLTLNGINIVNGVATVSLGGQLVLGGTCDAPRVQAQLEQTALQYSTVTAVSILVNGVPLADALSQQ